MKMKYVLRLKRYTNSDAYTYLLVELCLVMIGVSQYWIRILQFHPDQKQSEGLT